MKTANETAAGKPRYEILDGLRGVAAALVVAFHLFETYSGGDHARQIINHGYLAVDFFFALSGYVVGYAYDDRWAKGMTTLGFFRRRLVRLHPLAVIGTAFGALLFYFGESPAFPEIGGTSPWKLAAVALLCFTMIPLGKGLDVRGWCETNPLNGPVWSLQWEYLANAVYALFVRRLGKAALAALVAAAGAATVALCLDLDAFGVLAARSDAAYTVIGGWSLTADQLLVGATRLAYPFLVGLLLSRCGAAVRVGRGGFALCSALVAAALAMPYFAPESAPWVNGAYEAAVITALFPLVVAMGAGSAVAGRVESAVCRFLGEISYPLYATHFPLVYMQIAWAKAHPDAPAAQHAAVGVSAFLLAVAVAWAALKLLDEPIRNKLNKRKGTAK